MVISNFLDKNGIDFEVLPHHVAYDAQHVAQALHVSGHKVAKTVLLRVDHRYGYLVAVLPATKRIDFERLSRTLNGCEIELATEDEIADHCPDCEFGVLPPFGSQYAMQTVIDKDLAANSDLIIEGNTHQEALRMKMADFMRLEEPLVISFATT